MSKDRQKQPWLKFYPADWRSDAALRMCSIGARGLWMEMLCIMHDAIPCGSLLINGCRVTARELASLAGAGVKETEGWLAELDRRGVFSRDEDGTIFSRRMRRDVEKAEQDKANGKQGGNPKLSKRVNPKGGGGVNPPDKPNDMGEDKAQKPEARSQSPEAEKIESSPPALRPGPEAGGRAILSDEFVDKLRGAVEPEPVADDQDLSPIAAVLANGATEADVLEGIRIAFAKRTDPEPFRHWSAFIGWIERVVSGRVAGRRKPAAAEPVVDDGPKIRLMNGRPFTVALIREAERTGRWFRATMGPKRGEAGCLVPAWVFEEIAA